MSLLMEALKKAEEAKRRAGGASAAPEPLLEPLEPPPAPPPAGPLPNLSQHLDAIDAELADLPQTPPPRRSAPRAAPEPPAAAARAPGAAAARDRFAAYNVLAVKRPARSGGLFRAILVLGLLALLCMAVYYWRQWQAIPPGVQVQKTEDRGQRTENRAESGGWRMESAPGAGERAALSPGGSALARGDSSASPGGSPLSPGVSSTSPGVSPASPGLARAPRLSASGAAPGDGGGAPGGVAAAAPKASANAAPKSPVNAAPPKTNAAAETPGEAAGPAFRPTKSAPRADALLENAYAALLAGRDDDARRAYAQALRNDARNVDALLGMATLAARQGQDEAARAWYARALEADPNDATARAGVLAAGRPADAEAAESRLKSSLAAQPDSPPLNFALGNLYAREQRWSEAQQAYFQAYAGAPGDPDIVFNLAVSLDHLRQNKLAAQYYRLALEAARSRAPAFDPARAEARLRDLEH
ncbi:MAG: tetratricopeptide repeat protein [Candidatus Accumulibacter sp.]|jgi:tetratricopeptide (TPR) repeat protein|nr:tetratricopeptide repeat protein [Accumulibacter sp.]